MVLWPEGKKKKEKIKKKGGVKKKGKKEKKGKKRQKEVWSFLDYRKVSSTDQHPHFQGCASSDHVIRWFPVQGWLMSSWQRARPKDFPSVYETPRRCTARHLGTNSSLYSTARSSKEKKKKYNPERLEEKLCQNTAFEPCSRGCGCGPMGPSLHSPSLALPEAFLGKV